MITELRIRNYKSILDTTMELSNVNVFIGENGCGKTNILEAVGMLSAVALDNTDITSLINKGIRVTRPSLTLNSFVTSKQNNEFKIDYKYLTKTNSVIGDNLTLVPTDINDIYSKWSFSEKWVESSFNELFKDTNINFNKDELKKFFKLFRLQFQRKIKETGSLSTMTNTNVSVEDDDINVTFKLKDSLQAILHFNQFLIFNLHTQALRGITSESKEVPLGIYGEGLDVLLNDFSKEEWEILKRYTHLIGWLDDIVIDKSDKLKYEGHKLGRSNSVLYFRDKFMAKKNNVFAAENSNEGILHILFYLALVISKKTPRFFAIDNIESSLNPKLCRILMKILAELAIEMDKQMLITTHNPAILDGLNLHDDRQRLLIVKRSDEGYTQTERIRMKPDTNGQQLKLSELWMRGYLGGLPTNF